MGVNGHKDYLVSPQVVLLHISDKSTLTVNNSGDTAVICSSLSLCDLSVNQKFFSLPQSFKLGTSVDNLTS